MTNVRPAFLLLALLACSPLGLGCGSSSRPAFGGETNWLRRCDANNDCQAAGSCVCGLCSERCAEDDDCSAGLLCKATGSALVQAACGAGARSGLCSPECTDDADCGRAQACVEGACAPEPAGPPDAAIASSEPSTGTALPDGRTPQAYVLSALLPDSSCVYASDNAIVPAGLFDIAPGGAGSGDRCADGYDVRLSVASEEPGVLQLSGATVTLMTLNQETLLFDEQDRPLPNPFTYLASTTFLPAAGQETAKGIFEVEVIPAGYARFLADFDGDKILASITLQALDADDQPITFRPFLYPIEICTGCLTMCASRLSPELSREDLSMGKCDDNSGSDGRICFDPDC